jgi:hypothetical protein
MVLCEVAKDLTQNISNDIKSFFCFEIFWNYMILYYLVPTGTSPKLEIFEIQYNTIQTKHTRHAQDSALLIKCIEFYEYTGQGNPLKYA